MGILITVVLPLGLAVIMLSLGVGLEPADFRRVAKRPRAFFVGAVCQLLLIPATAFVLLQFVELPPEMELGIMLLSFCPGGVTSNIMAKFARADIALSVSLTAVISLLSILTVPFLAAWSVRHFLGEAGPAVDITGLALALFAITTLPVALGIALRRYARGFALRIEAGLSFLATVLFVVIVLAALAANWQVFIENVVVTGEILVILNLTLMISGLAVAWLSGLSWTETKTISVETGIQNATMGVTLAGLIAGTADGLGPLSLPSAVYGITMYLTVIPFLIWFRRRRRE